MPKQEKERVLLTCLAVKSFRHVASANYRAQHLSERTLAGLAGSAVLERGHRRAWHVKRIKKWAKVIKRATPEQMGQRMCERNTGKGWGADKAGITQACGKYVAGNFEKPAQKMRVFQFAFFFFQLAAKAQAPVSRVDYSPNRSRKSCRNPSERRKERENHYKQG